MKTNHAINRSSTPPASGEARLKAHYQPESTLPYWGAVRGGAGADGFHPYPRASKPSRASNLAVVREIVMSRKEPEKVGRRDIRMEGRKRLKRLREQAPEKDRLKEGATRIGTARGNPVPHPSHAGARAKATAGEEDETFKDRMDNRDCVCVQRSSFPPVVARICFIAPARHTILQINDQSKEQHSACCPESWDTVP